VSHRICYRIMTIRHTLIILIIGVASFRSTIRAAEERIWLKAKINGKPTRLCFDSGSNASALCARAVQKLGLKFIPAPTNAFSPGLLAGDTMECMLTLEGSERKTSFLVLDLPAYVNPDLDGLIGWSAISPNVLRIDAFAREVVFLSKVPTPTAQWARLSLVTNSGTLDLQIPYSERTNGVLCVDTGSDSGIALPAREWRRWKEAHPHCRLTLQTAFTPADGFFVVEQAWADQISVGPIILTGAPIEQAGPASAIRWGGQYEGTLGLAALKRLDFIVDGNNGLAYLRAKNTRPPTYPHNRLGAVFVPTSTQTNQAVAQVVDGGAAYEAGVRNGDVLLQVDKVAVTSWSESWLRHFRMPAGTKLKLRLRRDGKIFTTTATLRQILEPNPNWNKIEQ